LAHDRPDDTIMHGYMMGATAVHLDSCLITAERVHQAHNIGMAVLAWTVNERLEMERVVELGVDAVLSDYPQRLCALVRERRVAELVC
jgi:glycerophosphoryl diester phosphodiesterase